MTSEPDIKVQLLAWSKAIMVLDASEVLIRDLIERELADVARAAHVKVKDAIIVANRLTARVRAVRERAIKTAFRLVREHVGDTPIRGHSLATWAQTMLRDDMKGIDTAIRTGLIAGLENIEIARKVVGSMGLNGVDGVTEFTRHKIAHLGRVAVKDSIHRKRSGDAP